LILITALSINIVLPPFYTYFGIINSLYYIKIKNANVYFGTRGKEEKTKTDTPPRKQSAD
jgi:hypothetical protein